MKNLSFIFLGIGLLICISCTRETNVQPMLQDTEIRNEVFKMITEDHDLMTSFMRKMKENNHVMQMMKGDKDMMKMMMGGKEMNSGGEMENQQAMMKTMMSDGKKMGEMMKMMKEKGMMDEACMQSCMEMMAKKGMDMGSMNNIDNHESHNH